MSAQMTSYVVPERPSHFLPIEVLDDSDYSDTGTGSDSCRKTEEQHNRDLAVASRTFADRDATSRTRRQGIARDAAAHVISPKDFALNYHHSEGDTASAYAAPDATNAGDYLKCGASSFSSFQESSPRGRKISASPPKVRSSHGTFISGNPTAAFATIGPPSLRLAKREPLVPRDLPADPTRRQKECGSVSPALLDMSGSSSSSSTIDAKLTHSAESRKQAQCLRDGGHDDHHEVRHRRSGDLAQPWCDEAPSTGALDRLAESDPQRGSPPQVRDTTSDCVLATTVHPLNLSYDEELASETGSAASPRSPDASFEGGSSGSNSSKTNSGSALRANGAMSSDSAIVRMAFRRLSFLRDSGANDVRLPTLHKEYSQHRALISSADTTTQLSSCSSVQASSSDGVPPPFARRPRSASQQSTRTKSNAGFSHLFRSTDSEQYSRKDLISLFSVTHNDDPVQHASPVKALAATPLRAKRFKSYYGVPQLTPPAAEAEGEIAAMEQEESIDEYLREAAIVDIVNYSEPVIEQHPGSLAEIMQPGTPPKTSGLVKDEDTYDERSSSVRGDAQTMRASKDRADSENTLRQRAQQDGLANDATIVQSRRVAAPTYVKAIQVVGKPPRPRHTASPAVQEMLATSRPSLQPATIAATVGDDSQPSGLVAAVPEALSSSRTMTDIVKDGGMQEHAKALDRQHIILPGHFGERAITRGISNPLSHNAPGRNVLQSMPGRTSSTTSLPTEEALKAAEKGPARPFGFGNPHAWTVTREQDDADRSRQYEGSVEIMSADACPQRGSDMCKPQPPSDGTPRAATARPFASLQGSAVFNAGHMHFAPMRQSSGDVRTLKRSLSTTLRRTLSGSRATQSSDGFATSSRLPSRDDNSLQRTSKSPFSSRVLLRAASARLSKGSSTDHPPAQNKQERTLRQDFCAPLDEADIEVIEEQSDSTDIFDLREIRRRVAVDMAAQVNSTFGRRRHSRALMPVSQPSDPASPASEESIFSALSSDKERRKRFEAVDNLERSLSLEALGKTEMAYARIDVWTESRRGKWIVRNAAERDAIPADDVPTIADPWAIPIDSKGIIRRKKLKSNVEVTSTRTTVVCPDCREARSMGIVCNCKTCAGSERVVMVYTVQCTVRLAEFTPLILPAALITGIKQPHIKYIDTADPDHRADVLRDRAIDGLQSAASRVLKAHAEQHGSRLLMGRVTISRRGLLTVGVVSSKSRSRRLYDVEDGADGRVVDVTDKVKQAAAATAAAAAGFSASEASSANHMTHSRSDDHELRNDSRTNMAQLARQPPLGYRSASSGHLSQDSTSIAHKTVAPTTPTSGKSGLSGTPSKLATASISSPQPTPQTAAAVAGMQTSDLRGKALNAAVPASPPRRTLKALFGK